MDVSIILVNYNTCNLTISCIESIFKYTKDIDFEIIVVDNNSSDESQARLINDKRIIFIESGANLGFGRANNLGLSKAKGDFVFFLNSDTILLNNAVKKFWDFATTHSSFAIGALGCQLVDENNYHVHSSSNFPNIYDSFIFEIKDHISTLLGKQKTMRTSNYYKEDSFNYYEVDYVTGADMFVRRYTLNKHGGFDPDFFMYYEETELQHRWKKQGFHNFIIEGPRIVHLERKSSKLVNTFNREFRDLTSRILYFKKTESMCSYITFRIMLVCFRIHYFFKCSIKLNEKKRLLKLLFCK